MSTVALILAGAGRGQAQELPPVVVASGAAVVSRPPDVAYVSLAIESRAKSPRDAQRQNAEAAAAVVRELRDAGARRLRITTSKIGADPLAASRE